jgi:hypothetical protein
MSLRWINVLLLLIAGGLGVANLFLKAKLKEARTEYQQIQAASSPASGTTLKWIAGNDLNGRPLKLELVASDKKTLILVVARNCRYCEENWPFWRDVVNSKRAHVVFCDVGDDLDLEYFQQRGTQVPPSGVIRIAPQLAWLNKISATPTTLLLDREGRVEAVWVGVLNPEKVQLIIKSLT